MSEATAGIDTDVVLHDEVDGRVRVLTLDVDADDLLDALRESEGYVTETQYTSDTLISVSVEGYIPVSFRVFRASGPPEERSFEDYFSPVDGNEDEVSGLADKTGVVLHPYEGRRRERMAAAVGYVVGVIENM